MHYVRGLVMHHMAAVYHILGNRDKQAECYIAQQKDMQYMCKALPHHPLSYSLFARCAMNNQQMGVAAAFLEKGLAEAEAAGHDASVCMMSFQRAAALLLGGSGEAGMVDCMGGHTPAVTFCCSGDELAWQPVQCFCWHACHMQLLLQT